MELKTEFESGMRRVEATDYGSCCRLAGICKRIRNLEQGLVQAYGKAGKKLARKVSWLLGNTEVWRTVRGQRRAKMGRGRGRCCLRPLLTEIGDLCADDLEVHKDYN